MASRLELTRAAGTSRGTATEQNASGTSAKADSPLSITVSLNKLPSALAHANRRLSLRDQSGAEVASILLRPSDSNQPLTLELKPTDSSSAGPSTASSLSYNVGPDQFSTGSVSVETSGQINLSLLGDSTSDPDVSTQITGNGTYEALWPFTVKSKPSLSATKSASPSSIPEGTPTEITYSITTTNTGLVSMTLTSFADDVFGDLANPGNPLINTSTFTVPQTLAPGASYSAQFKAYVSGNTGTHTNTVIVSGVAANGLTASASAGFSLPITDVTPLMVVSLNANPSSVAEPGGTVTYSGSVTNTSPASTDPITIQSLTSTLEGDISSSASEPLPALILPGQSLTFSFTREISGTSGTLITNTVTATGADDEGNAVTSSDSATVSITA